MSFIVTYCDLFICHLVTFLQNKHHTLYADSVTLIHLSWDIICKSKIWMYCITNIINHPCQQVKLSQHPRKSQWVSYVNTPTFPLEENVTLIFLVITVLLFLNRFTAYVHILNIYVCSWILYSWNHPIISMYLCVFLLRVIIILSFHVIL